MNIHNPSHWVNAARKTTQNHVQSTRKEALAKWESVLNDICRYSAEFTNANDISAILERVGVQARCHAMVPTSGWINLSGARASLEDGCVEITSPGGPKIVKPRRLYLERPHDSSCEWWYLRLECSPMEPSGVYRERPSNPEAVTEVEAGHYGPYTWKEDGFYVVDGDEIPLPKGSREVLRYIDGGCFNFFSLASVYDYHLYSDEKEFTSIPIDEFRQTVSTVEPLLRNMCAKLIE